MKRLYSLLGALLVVVIVVGGGYLYFSKKGTSSNVIKDSGDNLSDYSAVFVSGGGIYFGKITDLTDTSMRLENVYNYGVVPDSSSTSSSSTSQATKPTLFDASKVGIAPAKMYNINRSQIILWYSLRNDSDVVTTIDKYQKSGQ